MTLKIHPVDRLLTLEGTGRAPIPYLGYVEDSLQIPGIRGYSKDIMLLVILIRTYAKKVLVMEGKNYQQGNGSNYEGGTSQGSHSLQAGPLQCGHVRVTSVAPKHERGMGPWEGDTPFNNLWPHYA